MIRLFFITCFFISAHGFILPNIPKLDGRIVGGEDVDISEVPYQVAVLYDFTASGLYRQSCGGSIINPNVIATAAHCIDGTQSAQWLVRAGSSSSSSGGQTIYVEKFLLHPSYSNRLDYDVSLLFLTSSILIDNVITASISLPDESIEIADGTFALVTGWGAIIEGGGSVDLLQKVSIPIVNQEVCFNIYSGINIVTDRMICAGVINEGGMDACQGDSGGPLAIDGMLIGITSWGRGCARPGNPGVWTRVSAIKAWIDLETENYRKINKST